MESLKTQLNKLIQARGKISRREILEMCDGLPQEDGKVFYPFGRTYELSNAERRLRQSPDIEALDEDGRPARETNKAIREYVWKGEPKTTLKFIPDKNDPSKVICEKVYEIN